MSDTPARTGIGGIAASDADGGAPAWAEEQPPMPARPIDNRFEEMGTQLQIALTELRALSVSVEERLGAIAQLQGQMSQYEVRFEHALPQHVQAIQTLDARITAIGQQVSRNLRLAALDAAVKSKGSADLQRDVLTRAREFFEFLTETDEERGSEAPPPGSLSH